MPSPTKWALPLLHTTVTTPPPPPSPMGPLKVGGTARGVKATLVQVVPNLPVNMSRQSSRLAKCPTPESSLSVLWAETVGSLCIVNFKKHSPVIRKGHKLISHDINYFLMRAHVRVFYENVERYFTSFSEHAQRDGVRIFGFAENKDNQRKS